MRKKILAVFVMSLWVGSVILGVDKTASIQGTIVFHDKNDISTAFPLPDVKITLKSRDIVKSARTGVKGHFRFNSLESRKYLLKTELPGFSTIYKIVNLREGKVLKLSIKMGTAKRRCEDILGCPGENEGVIDGVVRFRNGDVIPGIKVSISSGTGKFKHSTYSDENGQYYFFSLKPGKYRLTFEFPGVRSKKIKVKVSRGNIIKLNTKFTIHLNPLNGA